MDNDIDAFFDKPVKKKFYYDWSTLDTLLEVDRLMESHHGWRSVNWQSLPGTKEISSHSLKQRKYRS